MRRERSAVRIQPALPTALALVACVLALSPAGSRAAASNPAPRCRPQGYGLEQLALPVRNEHQKAVRLTAGWLTGREERRSCALRTTIRVTIADSGGVEARGRWHVRTVLNPWSEVVHTWAWRNWCPVGGQREATITFSLPDGTSVAQHVSDLPTCVDANAATTLVDLGTGTKYVKRPGQRIPPHILPRGTPPPLHQELIKVKNGWLVSDGYTLVAVYAGRAGNNASRGRFAVIHQNLIFGVQYEPPDLVDIPKAGALKITRGPHGVARETSAQRGRLTFTSAHGVKGVLDLHGDRVRIK